MDALDAVGSVSSGQDQIRTSAVAADSAATAASPSDRKQPAVGGDLGVAATSAASVVFVSPSATPVAASSVSRAALATDRPGEDLPGCCGDCESHGGSVTHIRRILVSVVHLP